MDMESFEPKKLLLLRILELLTYRTDCDHKLKQSEIVRLLKSVYGIECERKAVARNIELLQNANYDIVSDRTGSYLSERKFEIVELRLLIDSVLVSRHICAKHTTDLIKKLLKEGGKHFKSSIANINNLDDCQKTE